MINQSIKTNVMILKTKVKTGSLFVFMSIVIASCTVTHKISHWQSIEINPDGVSEEYTTPLRYFDIESKVQFTFSNDFENIYFCIRATEEAPQLKILQAGLQIGIDTLGNKKNIALLEFPLNQHSKNNAPPSEKSDKKVFKGEINELKDLLNEFKISGFNVPINGIIPMQNQYGIKLAIQFNKEKDLTIEGVIPFRTFFKEKVSFDDIGKPIYITIEINEMQKPLIPNHINEIPGNQPFNKNNGAREPRAEISSGNMDMSSSKGHFQNRDPHGAMNHESNIENYPFNKNITIKIKYTLTIKK